MEHIYICKQNDNVEIKQALKSHFTFTQYSP